MVVYSANLLFSLPMSEAVEHSFAFSINLYSLSFSLLCALILTIFLHLRLRAVERGWTYHHFVLRSLCFLIRSFIIDWYADNVSYSCSLSNWDWIRLVATLFQLMEMVQSHKGSTSPITNRDRYMKICILHFQFSFCISFQWLHFSLLPYDVFYNGWQLTLYSCSRSTNRKSLGQKVYNILLQFF